jgi:hypothetical protein
VNIGMTALFLLIGIGNLAWLMWIVWSWQN